MKKEKSKKIIMIVLTVLLSVVLLFIILITGLKLVDRIKYSSFYKLSQKEFAMPGKNSGFVGQGLDYVEEANAFITCGYSAKKGQTAMVYLVDEKGNAKKTNLKNADGSNYVGHTGGIAHYREYFYVTGDDGCDVFLLSDLLEGKKETLKVGEVKTFNDPAYCNVHNGKFYAGSFYRKGNYETPEWQRMITPVGDKNKAVITVFGINDGDSENFYISEKPIAAYSTTGLVQGMTFNGSQMILSLSYGLATSHLNFYDTSSIVGGEITIDGSNVPLFYLDSSCLTRSVEAPPMSEEIVYKDGRIYIMNESASNKYIFGKFTSGNYLLSWKAE